MPLKERAFAMQGIHGQTFYVRPATGIMMVLTSIWDSASGRQDPQPYGRAGCVIVRRAALFRW
jgi:hypothetical protein